MIVYEVRKILVILIVIFGFLYGKDYFKFYEPIKNPNGSLHFGMYILSLKWWNIKFNWYVIQNQWHMDISAIFLINIKQHSFREYVLVMSSTGIKACTIDINKDKSNK